MQRHEHLLICRFVRRHIAVSGTLEICSAQALMKHWGPEDQVLPPCRRRRAISVARSLVPAWAFRRLKRTAPCGPIRSGPGKTDPRIAPAGTAKSSSSSRRCYIPASIARDIASAALKSRRSRALPRLGPTSSEHLDYRQPANVAVRIRSRICLTARPVRSSASLIERVNHAQNWTVVTRHHQIIAGFLIRRKLISRRDASSLWNRIARTSSDTGESSDLHV